MSQNSRQKNRLRAPCFLFHLRFANIWVVLLIEAHGLVTMPGVPCTGMYVSSCSQNFVNRLQLIRSIVRNSFLQRNIQNQVQQTCSICLGQEFVAFFLNFNDPSAILSGIPVLTTIAWYTLIEYRMGGPLLRALGFSDDLHYVPARMRPGNQEGGRHILITLP